MSTSVRHELVFRPRPGPARTVPVGARSAGLHLVDPPWGERHPPRPLVEVLWCDQGAGTLLLHGVHQRLGAGEAAVLLPGMEHAYAATAPGWRLHWWTLDGPLAAAATAASGLEAAVYRAGDPPLAALRALAQALADPAREYQAGAMAYALLAELAARVAPATPASADALVRRALDLLHRRWADPAWGVAAAARQLGVHRSLLSRRFTAVTGEAPARYLLRLRLDAARALLAGSSLPVAAVAARCGFADPSYFARLLRRATGQAPRDLRRG